MRVLLTTDTVGGVWIFTRELAQQLASKGHSVALVSFGRAPSSEQKAWAAVHAKTYRECFEFHPCEAPLEWMQDNAVAWDTGAALLTRIAEQFQPDILHSSQFCWGALNLGIPILVTAHSDVCSWAAASRSGGLEPSDWLDRYHALVQDGIYGAVAMVAPTIWMREALRMHFDVLAPFHVIANGRTLADSPVERKRRFQAVSAGRLWDEGKGLKVLGEVLSPMAVLVAGETSFEDVVRGPSQSRVTALGRLDEDDLLELFRTSSVYLATSLYEPFGLAPIEAALCGCTIVARDLPSFREVWGDAAFYFKDPSDLQSLLTELADHPNKLHDAQVAAKARADRFTALRMANSYASLYRELIVNGSARSVVQGELHAA